MSVIHCTRCGGDKEGIDKPAFYQGEIRAQLRANACCDCWSDWIRMQMMLVNEYRLNLMDPKTDEFLNAQVLAFFKLTEQTDVADVKYVPPTS